MLVTYCRFAHSCVVNGLLIHIVNMSGGQNNERIVALNSWKDGFNFVTDLYIDKYYV